MLKQLRFFSLHQKIICFTDKTSTIPKPDPQLTYIYIDFTKPIGKQVAHGLFTLGIASVMVEGGFQTLSAFIIENIWDEARVFTSENSLGTGVKAPKIFGKIIGEEDIEQDHLQFLLPLS